MSTYLESHQEEQVITLAELKNYFQEHARPVSGYLLGLEWELFGNVRNTVLPMGYGGEAGIEAVLRELKSRFGYRSVEENGHVTALSRDENYVALEPGGQVELSAGPVKTVHDIRGQLEQFRHELLEVSEHIPVTWLNVGFHPFARLEQIDWVPKRRYELMREYLAERGGLAHDMMKRTVANQVSVDYCDEADAMDKLRVIYALTSLASAFFSHSPMVEGKLSGYLTYRMHAWSRTDDVRSGLVPFFLRENGGFEEYLDYALDVPMMFIIREKKWIPVKGLSFREYLNKGFDGFAATRDDFELHLSTLFPEARLKRCIEIRGADAQLFEDVPAVPAFWKGILYDKIALADAWNAVRDFSWPERCSFHHDMKKMGLKARLGRHEGWGLMREIFAIARRGLKSQSRLNGAGQDETVYLDSMAEKTIKAGKAPAEILIEKWSTEFNGDPARLLEYLSLK